MAPLKILIAAAALCFPMALHGQRPDSLAYAQKMVKQWDQAAYASPDGASSLKSAMELSQKRPVLLFIWAPWCPYCKELMPVMEVFHRRGVTVIGIPVDDSKANVEAAAVRHGMSFPQLYGAEGSVASRTEDKGFDFPAVPVQLIIYKGEVKFYAPGSYGDQTDAILTEELGKYK